MSLIVGAPVAAVVAHILWYCEVESSKLHKPVVIWHVQTCDKHTSSPLQQNEQQSQQQQALWYRLGPADLRAVRFVTTAWKVWIVFALKLNVIIISEVYSTQLSHSSSALCNHSDCRCTWTLHQVGQCKDSSEIFRSSKSSSFEHRTVGSKRAAATRAQPRLGRSVSESISTVAMPLKTSN